jgi:hypothetical protein
LPERRSKDRYPLLQAKSDPELKTLATNPELDKLIAGFERKAN